LLTSSKCEKYILYTVGTKIQFWTTFLLVVFAENEANKSYGTFCDVIKTRKLTDSVRKLNTDDSKLISWVCVVLPKYTEDFESLKTYIFLIDLKLLGNTRKCVLPFLHSSVVVLKYQWQKSTFQKFTNSCNISHSWQKMINFPIFNMY